MRESAIVNRERAVMNGESYSVQKGVEEIILPPFIIYYPVSGLTIDDSRSSFVYRAISRKLLTQFKLI